jgi:hypothetical protein
MCAAGGRVCGLGIANDHQLPWSKAVRLFALLRVQVGLSTVLVSNEPNRSETRKTNGRFWWVNQNQTYRKRSQPLLVTEAQCQRDPRKLSYEFMRER